jgi:hypothetical protein
MQLPQTRNDCLLKESTGLLEREEAAVVEPALGGANGDALRVRIIAVWRDNSSLA